MTAEELGKVIAAHILHSICDVTGIRVTSWKRGEQENASVGGAPRSLHLLGAAIDFGRETPEEKIDRLKALGFTVEYHTKGTAPHYHAYGSWKQVAGAAALGAVLGFALEK